MHNMLDSKSVSTPLVVGSILTLHDSASLMNATMYRQLVGGLKHVRITRPNVSFVVNKLSQFMHALSKYH